ncbi:hypothetical protein Dimus_000401 [Dionaea muscipula]
MASILSSFNSFAGCTKPSPPPASPNQSRTESFVGTGGARFSSTPSWARRGKVSLVVGAEGVTVNPEIRKNEDKVADTVVVTELPKSVTAYRRWSARALKSIVLAELEARKLKYPDTGTESLLMGILVEGTSMAAKFLRSHGITFFKVQQEIVDLLGKAESSNWSPQRPPLTEQAQKAIDWAIDMKLRSGLCIVGESGDLTTPLLLLGIWAQEVSAGHKILENLGFNDEKAKELANFMDKEIIST